MPALVHIKDVSKYYDQTPVLKSINFDIPQNCVFGLLGPNGAGKTSLIRILNGITRADEGTVLIDGQTPSDQVSSYMGYLPEERGLYKKMKVAEQLIYLARLKGLTKAEAVEHLKYWFDRLEIKGWTNKNVEELSKGMQQKVQFISTVMHKPKLLILDEPFSGFDPVNANLIKHELLELKKQGCTIILSTHNMSSVEELCDEIALIHKGKIVLSGRVNDIKTRFSQHIYEFQFKNNMAEFSNALWSAGEVISFVDHQGYFSAKVKFNDRFTRQDILKNLVSQLDILGFYEILPSMNDIFIQHVTEEVSV